MSVFFYDVNLLYLFLLHSLLYSLVNSGCRCEKNNARVGWVKGSKHVKVKAYDLSCKLGAMKMFEAVKKLKSEGILGDLDYCIMYRRKNFVS